jgi:hypothetical protein
MSIYNFDDITICWKSSSSGSSKRADEQPAIPQIIAFIVIVLVPLAVGVRGLTIRSSAEAWESS